LRGYFDGDSADDLEESFRAAWREIVPDLPIPDVHIREIPETDWLASFRAASRPVAVGDRLWVSPPNVAPEEGWDPGAIVVTIEPAQGFGTGTHPTTRALLRWLEAEPDFTTALDVGTGSGVLALAAIALGARRAVGLENDLAALENATTNRRLNGAWALGLVGGSTSALRDGIRFDRVLANLNRATLEALLPELVRRVLPSGRLGVAGLLEGEEERILELIARAGWVLAERSVEADPATGDRWWSGWFRSGDC
jgi:ribosomal protein L11 methyltransferase